MRAGWKRGWLSDPAASCLQPARTKRCGASRPLPRSTTAGWPAGGWPGSGTFRRLRGRFVPPTIVHGNTAAFFAWDQQPVTDDEIEATLRLLAASRRELLATLRRFQPDRLTLRPGGGARTVEQIARHVATVEWWYMSRVVPFPFPKDGEYPEELEELMAWIRERVAGRLRRLSHQERAATPVPDEESGERWSARKVLRRLIYHELYHLRQLRRALPA